MLFAHLSAGHVTRHFPSRGSRRAVGRRQPGSRFLRASFVVIAGVGVGACLPLSDLDAAAQGVAPSQGGAGGRDASAGAGNDPTGGAASCSLPRLDCDDDPSTCETDVTDSLEHCGSCDNACLGAHDECIDGECVTPCIEETAFELEEPNHNYSVPADGCVIIRNLAGQATVLQSNTDLPFTYTDQCGNGDTAELRAYQNYNLDNCVVVVDLQGPSTEVVLRWWEG
jgi:hypothetical protein